MAPAPCLKPVPPVPMDIDMLLGRPRIVTEVQMKWRTGRATCLAAVLVGVVALAGCSKSADEYVTSGDAFVADGKHAEAIVEYQNAIQQDATDGEARLKLARSYEALGQLPQAFREYVRAADLLPDNAEVQVRAGTFLLLGGQFEEAKARAQQALEVDPRNADAQIILGNATAGLKDLPGAIREMQEAIALEPEQGRGYSALGAIQLAQGDAAAAEAAFRKAVEVEPESVQAHLALGNFLWSVNRRAEAVASIQRALEIDENNVLANQLMATFHVSGDTPADAEPYFRRLAENVGNPDAKLALGDFYLRINRLEDGRKVLLEAAAQHQTYAPASRRLASLAFAEGRKADAYRLVDEILEKNAKDSESLTLKGRFLSADDRAEEAREAFRAAVAAQPDDAAAQFALGLAEAGARNTDAAIAAFNEVLRINPRASAAQLQLAHLYLARGDVQQGATMSEDALRNAPDNPMARLVQARTRMMQGQLDEAALAMAALEKQYPNVWPVLAQQGTLKALQGDRASARRYWERAIALEPSAFEAQRGLVRLELAAGNAEGALTRAQALASKFPGDVRYPIEVGRLAAGQRRFDEAEAALRTAIELDPAAMEAYGLLGQVYLVQNKVDAARGEFEAIVKRQPKAVGAHTMIAMILQGQGKVDEAITKYEEVVAIDRRAAVASNNLAWLYAEGGHGNLDQALELAQVAKEVLPDQPEVNDTLGFIYLKKQIPSLAVPPMLIAVEKDPQNPTYHYRLGQAYLETGNKAKAKDALEQALKLKSDFPEARALLAQAAS